jgi:hypothetical protein
VWKGLGADSEEKHELVSDIDTIAAVNGRLEKQTYFAATGLTRGLFVTYCCF